MHRRRRTSRRATLAAIATVMAVASVAAGCTRDEEWRATALTTEHLAEPDAFYRWTPEELEGEPGTLVRAERVLGAPEGAVGWRMLFRSRDVHDDPVIVSGVVLAPAGTARSPRPIVSWGHPTTGAAQHCAPSMGVDPFVLIEGATDLLADGDVVVASDYPGMGAAGPWSYLIGVSEGRSVLDAARAAREIDGTGAGDDLLLWGHSQGGHAALFAAAEAASYAPELDLRAIAVAAPAVELAQLLADDIGDSAGVALGSYAFWAYARTFATTTDPPQLRQILTPDGVRATPAMAERCLIGQHRSLHLIADPLVGRYVATSPTEVPSWSTLLDRNTPAAQRYDVPMLVAQGGEDHLVRPATTTGFVRQLCRAGQPVDYHWVPRASHLTIAVDSMGEVRDLFRRAVRGEPTPDTCADQD